MGVVGCTCTRVMGCMYTRVEGYTYIRVVAHKLLRVVAHKLLMPEESIMAPGAGVAGSCDLTNTGAGNQTKVKSHKYS